MEESGTKRHIPFGFKHFSLFSPKPSVCERVSLFLYFMNMYIGNLSYNVRESDLRQVMEEYGTVESVKLIMDRNTNRSKGFAFVEMPEAAEAQQAINKLNGAEYVGRQMVVKEALPRN